LDLVIDSDVNDRDQIIENHKPDKYILFCGASSEVAGGDLQQLDGEQVRTDCRYLRAFNASLFPAIARDTESATV
jgi:hypothetical protein